MKKWVLALVIGILASACGYVTGYNRGYNTGLNEGDHSAWRDTARYLDSICNDSCCTLRIEGKGDNIELVVNGGRINGG